MNGYRQATELGTKRYNRDRMLAISSEVICCFRLSEEDKSKMRGACCHLADALDCCSGSTLQQRWSDFETKIWPQWAAGHDRPCTLWTWGARVLVPMRMVIPSIAWLSDVRVNQWIVRLREDHPLRQQHSLLLRATAPITWTSSFNRHLAVSNGLRILLARGYDSLHQIQDDDLKLLSSRWSKGTDALDAALCSLGVFSRTPKRGSARHSRRRRLTASELVEIARVPERFRQVAVLYLETYEARVSDVYRTLRHKSIALAYFWNFMADKHPDVKHCSTILPRTSATIFLTLLRAPELSSAARERAKKCVRLHMPGWWSYARSFPIFVHGQLRLIPHSRLWLHARFLSTDTHFLAMASKRRVRERAPASPPPSLNLSARCPRFALWLSSVGGRLWLHRRSALHAATLVR